MKQELQLQQETQQGRDGEIAELKGIVQTMVGQVKGNGKALDPRPDASDTG